ncbi:DEKNAAC100116 [Brettanomyces naardenensis]|uniref:DEKNAAC100116 n=1 Tax=Brettanomyces naardenensis TaxID=13370 RepID=A0A448YEV9_BRENA|nr:DEKNAAC100116 [Brettanomyces naardenensis]
MIMSSFLTNPSLYQVYDLEQEAERAILEGEFDKAIERHSEAISGLSDVLSHIKDGKRQNDEKGLVLDDYGAIRSLEVLKEQINIRIDQLTQYKREPVHRNSHKEEINNSLLGGRDEILLNTLVDRINLALIRTLNIDARNDEPISKVHFIQSEKINALEHKLQILNFKEKSSKQTTLKLEDIQTKNTLLEELNSLYYSELMANHELVKRVVSGIQSLSKNNSESESTETKEIKPTGPQDENTQLKIAVSELQQRNAELERTKVSLEDQIVLLKERWNNLVKSARKRKDEQRLQLQQSDVQAQ